MTKQQTQEKISAEGIYHDKENKIDMELSTHLDDNIKNLDVLFKDCVDLVKREVNISNEMPFRVLGVYIDGMINRQLLDGFFLSRIIDYKNLNGSILENRRTPNQIIMEHFSATFDIKESDKMDDIVKAVLSGDSAVFVDNSEKALIIATRGWPNRGVGEPATESVVRGSRDGFTESVRFNTALIRRRIRDTKLKVKSLSFGLRSRTDIAVMYMDDIAKPELVEEVMERLDKYEVDAIFDSGYIEQLIEESWKSPFPQTQVTERPDKVASSLLEGKVAIVVDNSPFVIIVPTTLNAFFQASEDYYQRWQIMSFTRILRYLVSFLSFTLPGFYIALLNFQPGMLPTPFAISIAAARAGITFPSVLEIIVMELTFELFREAGIRIPGAIGHVIGLVGGIVIGQAAVEARIISPMIIIIVAFTAICTFAIPDYNLTSAFRLVRFFFIIASALFGLYGFLLAMLFILAHLSSLESFRVPYLAPYNASDRNGFRDLRDTILRFPTFMHITRPIFSKENQRIRIRLKEDRMNQDLEPGTETGSQNNNSDRRGE